MLPRAGIVHRLDKDTSGLMLVGKTLPAVEALTRQIAARSVHRMYVALAHGAWKSAGTGTEVEQALGRDPRNRLRMAVLPEGSSGSRAAHTSIQLLGQGVASGSGQSVAPVSYITCKLHTGRTHQIRVHLAWLGHPLLADTLYGGRPLLGLQRQALHAQRLMLEHPITRQRSMCRPRHRRTCNLRCNSWVCPTMSPCPGHCPPIDLSRTSGWMGPAGCASPAAPAPGCRFRPTLHLLPSAFLADHATLHNRCPARKY
jgi:RluA family pseudouridine synthase